MARARKEVRGAGAFAFLVPPQETLAAKVLKKAPYNPNRMAPDKFAALKASIQKSGFIQPMVVQRRSPAFGDLVLVGGHHRLAAALEIGEETGLELPPLPCIVLDLDDREARILNIALNNVTGEFDARLLAEALSDIQEARKIQPADTLRMGMKDEDVSRLLRLVEPPRVGPSIPPPTFGRSITLSLEFEDIATRDAVKEKLVERSGVEQKKTGAIVLELLSARRRK